MFVSIYLSVWRAALGLREMGSKLHVARLIVLMVWTTQDGKTKGFGFELATLFLALLRYVLLALGKGAPNHPVSSRLGFVPPNSLGQRFFR